MNSNVKIEPEGMSQSMAFMNKGFEKYNDHCNQRHEKTDSRVTANMKRKQEFYKSSKAGSLTSWKLSSTVKETIMKLKEFQTAPMND